MKQHYLLALVASASACTIPTTPLSNTITTPFRIQVQNASYPAVNNLYMNLLEAGGGDKHLYIGPVGTPTSNLVLTQGVIEQGAVHAVIGGEHSTIDNTDKMFMTERGDARAIFQPTYACNPETDALQIELRFVTWQNHAPGQWICVRPTYDNAYEFRYYPPGNTANDPNKFCVKVTLVAVGASGTGTTLSTSTTRTSTPIQVSTSTSTTVTASTTPPAGTSSPLPYTDMTSNGFSFVGCAPEERNDPSGAKGRTLPGVLYADDTLTNDKCTTFCAGKGYKYAGTEYARECWCANSYPPSRQPKTTKASLAGCSTKCKGNAAQYCGGGDWLSLYQACPAGGPCVNANFT
ncbi:carbohydrate-binding WSC domain protein [Rhexocercosporidium sp. MPI-PUGE-AT-0058]|nr:carbohydrate-binding WSC domain protein [Rhexocercosporidium sp. MPI-PUGE-AT-0058]